MTTEATPGALGSNDQLGLVERLRQERRPTVWTRGLDTDYPTAWEPNLLAHEAAQEIERLRATLDQKHAEYEDLKQCAANNARNQGLKIETLLRGITDARCLIDPIWRERMGAEQVREHVQRGMRCIASAITDCRFTEPNVRCNAGQTAQEG